VRVIRVLHIDDDPEQSRFLKIFLETSDPSLHVESTISPHESLKLIKSKNFDCIICDYQMPLMNGIQLSIAIRENKDTPIIIYTGHGSEEIAEAAFTAGVDDYVRKEINPSHYQVLANRVKQSVEKYRAEKELLDSLQTSEKVLTSLPSGIIIYEYQPPDKLIFIDANPAALQESKIVLGKVQGRDFHEVWKSNEYELKQRYVEAIKSQTPVIMDRIYWDNDLVQGFFKIHAFPISENRIVVSFDNISDQVETETRLKVSNLKEEQNRKRLEVLHRHALDLDKYHTREEVFNYTVELIVDTFGFENAEILIAENQTLRQVAMKGYLAVDVILPLNGPGICVRCFIEAKTITINDVSKTPDYLSLTELESNQIKSELVTPIFLDDDVLGVLNIQSPVLERFSDVDRRLVETFASHVSKAISRIKQMEEITSSEQRYRSILDESRDAVFVLTGFTVQYVNERVAELLGYDTREELLNMSPIDMIAPEDRELISGRIDARRRGENVPNKYEFRMQRKDGSIVHVETHVNRIIYEGKPSSLSFVRDISDRKRIEEALNQSEGWFRYIYEESPMGIELYDKDGYLYDANKADLDFFGVESVDNFRQWNLFKDSALTEQQKNKLKNGETVNLITERNFDDIKNYETSRTGISYFEAIFKPVIIKEGDTNLAYIALIKDITDIKTTENQLREYTEKLEQAVNKRTQDLLEAERLAAAGRIASMVGHDLRGPLQAIRNATYFIRHSPEKTETELERIDNAVKRAIDMLEELRNRTREDPIKLIDADLSFLIGEVINQTATSPNIEIVEKQNGNLTNVRIDPLKINRVLDNLIRNAIDAMPDGGKITLDASRDTKTITLKVSDTGIGMSQADVEKLFTPFYTTKQKGLGLGLAYCKRAVEAHQGTISVESVENQGTTFTIVIPV